MSSYQHDLARQYIAAGFLVHPVSPAKHPLSKRGFHDATIDPAMIDQWWGDHPEALVGTPTGPQYGVELLDIDGICGRNWLFDGFMRRNGIESLYEFSGCVVETPRGGLHVYGRSEGGNTRTRAGDIATGVDYRSTGGFGIGAGNRLPDGRMYRRIDGSGSLIPTLSDMRVFPRRLEYLATFNWRERAEIRDDAVLRKAIAKAQPREWPGILAAHRAEKAKRIMARTGPPTGDAMRRQALSDLDEAAAGYGSLRDGRRNGLFSVSCRIARYVVNGVITENELRTALLFRH